MGVLNCDRSGCDNVMSDYYSHTHGYLCWECRNELLSSVHRYHSIYEFMNTPKSLVEDNLSISYDAVVEEFKERHL